MTHSKHSKTIAQLKALREEIATCLQAVLDNNPGVTLHLERCTFGQGGDFVFKLTGTLPGGKSREAVAYEAMRAALALPEQTYVAKWGDYIKGPLKPGIKLPPIGTAFSSRGVRYVVAGATRTKVICRDLQGKQWTFKPEVVAKMTQVGEAA